MFTVDVKQQYNIIEICIVFFVLRLYQEIFYKTLYCNANDSIGPTVSVGSDCTVMCLSIGTPKNNKFSICSKRKINYF